MYEYTEFIKRNIEKIDLISGGEKCLAPIECWIDLFSVNFHVCTFFFFRLVRRLAGEWQQQCDCYTLSQIVCYFHLIFILSIFESKVVFFFVFAVVVHVAAFSRAMVSMSSSSYVQCDARLRWQAKKKNRCQIWISIAARAEWSAANMAIIHPSNLISRYIWKISSILFNCSASKYFSIEWQRGFGVTRCK